jgi:type II secretory pathway pseudopilin PulG
MASYSITRRSRLNERGYALLTLLLAMALMAIFAAAIVPTIKFQMERDREEEMIHRGTQYSRAIRGYYKKFGRYPVKIEDLESTNNLRFLRKRYKDPLNCKEGKCQDFKLLHFGEVQMTLSALGGGIPGATSISAMNGSNNSPGGFGTSNTFGQSSTFVQSSFGQNSFGQSANNTIPASNFGQSSAFGGNSSFGGNSNSAFGTNSSAPGGSTNQPSANGQTGTDSTDASTQVTPAPGTKDTDTGDATTQIIGGPIVGVASTSKDKTIREFNHKKKYKEWVFVYDPGQDQGRLITTPYQPQLQGFTQTNLNGQNGQNGVNGTNNSFGPSNGFGSSFGNSPNGMQNNPGTPSPNGYPNQQNNSPQQPQ